MAKKMSKPKANGSSVGGQRSFKKIADKIDAEGRWNLSGRMRPEVPNIPNEHLILEMVASYGMTRRQITENLLLYPKNVDCIVNDDQRMVVCAWLGINEPSEDERVQYAKEQVIRSSSGGDAWMELVKGDKIVDLSAYFKLRLKRLDEQVGRAIKQEQYRRVRASEDKTSVLGAMKFDGIADVEIPRSPTGVVGMDLLGGQDEHNPNLMGFCEGDLVLFAGGAGVGKTKICLAMAAAASSPMSDGRSLYNQGEFDLPVFKRRYCKGVVKGDEDLYISDKRSINDIVAMMYAIKPRWVFIDSKDKVSEANNVAGWKRVQNRLRQVARDIRCTVFLISHLNVDGSVKGGTSPQHDVDSVITAKSVKGCPGLFTVTMTKNRAGAAGEDRTATFRHIGNKVLCIVEPPRYKVEVAGQVSGESNPILDKLPESVSEEESILKEESDLLSKISENGFEALGDDEKKRLKDITEWRVSKDKPDIQRKSKEQRRDARRREQDEKKKFRDRLSGDTGPDGFEPPRDYDPNNPDRFDD